MSATPSSATPLVERLAQADPDGALAVAKEIARALEDANEPFRYQLAVLLEERKLLRWAAWLAPHVITHATSPSEEALWRALNAWASFVGCDYVHCEDEALKVVNATLGTSPIDRGARTRALTMLAYTRDVAGDHGAASAWYRQALEAALPHQRPGLLLDLGTSLSKQGRYDESLVAFDNALAALPDAGEPRATRLHAQVLSRRAALLELMGNAAQAVALQQEAIALARSVRDRDGELSASLRLVRHLVALRRFDDALVTLDKLAELASTERYGRLYVAHDRARLLRARRAWSDARAAYVVAIELLPPAAGEIVRGNLDVWLEITSGLVDVSSRLGDLALEDLARRAHGSAAELAAARGLYRGEPVERARLAERAAEAVDALRSELRARLPGAVTTADFVIDFRASQLTRRATSQSLPLRPSDVEILRLLVDLPRDGRAQRRDLVRALSKANVAKGSVDRFKDVIHEMRLRLGLSDTELIVGRRDRRGGYALAWETTSAAGVAPAGRKSAKRAPRTRG